MSFGKNWRYAHASVIGLAHLSQQTECQDRLICRTLETAADGEILIAAIADGAGSTVCGQIGAKIACESFVEQITGFLKTGNTAVRSLNQDFGAFWIEFFQKRVREIAQKEKRELREYASTFIGAVVGAGAAAFYQVGDGGAVFSTDGAAGSYQFAVDPIESEYVNVTEFLTDDAAATALRFRFIEQPIEDVILFSDGIYGVAVNFQNNQPHEPFLMPMIAPLRNGANAADLNGKLENFLQSPKLNEKTDDDKTIILASKRGV